MGGDAGAGSQPKKWAPRSTAGDGATTRASSVPPVEQQPEPLPTAAGVVVAASATDGGGSAAVQQSFCGGCGEDAGDAEDDDEQVERFYALLANIRALRGLYSGGGRKKRPREEAEAPWRPAFRMEDFEVGEVVVSQGQRTAAEDALGAVAKQQSSATTLTRPRGAAAAANGHEEGEVAEEARGRGLRRRVAARG